MLNLTSAPQVSAHVFVTPVVREIPRPAPEPASVTSTW
jgi:hypothetical protein